MGYFIIILYISCMINSMGQTWTPECETVCEYKQDIVSHWTLSTWILLVKDPGHVLVQVTGFVGSLFPPEI